MKKSIIYIIFFVLLSIGATFLLFFYQNKEKEVTPFQKFDDTFLENDLKPVGIIENGEFGQLKQIGGYLKEFDEEKIVLGNKKDTQENLTTIQVDENIIPLKAKYLLDEIGYDVESVPPEEIEFFKKQKNYVQVLVDEIIRETGEISYYAINILFFPD